MTFSDLQLVINTCHSWRHVARVSSPAGSVGQVLRGILIDILERRVLWSEPRSAGFFVTGLLRAFHLLLCLGLSSRGYLPFLSSCRLEIKQFEFPFFLHVSSSPYPVSCGAVSPGLLYCRLWWHILGSGRSQQSGHPDGGPGRWHLQGLLLPHCAWRLHCLHQVR